MPTNDTLITGDDHALLLIDHQYLQLLALRLIFLFLNKPRAKQNGANGNNYDSGAIHEKLANELRDF